MDQVADQHPEAGGFGCRVLNPDGSYQHPARPFPTIWRYWVTALFMRPLAYFSDLFISDIYTGWDGNTERTVDWQCGCCVMFRGALLKSLGGFDEQFFYHFEESDLCRRVWQAGSTILYTPIVSITHLRGQSVNRFPIRFLLESYRNRYRYFYKYYGRKGAQRCRRVSLAFLRGRQLVYSLVGLVRPTETLEKQMQMYRVAVEWNKRLDPVQFIENGEEPEIATEVSRSPA